MEQGEYEVGVITQAMATGRPIPAKIQNAPQLRPGLDLYYDAFLDMNSCRASGMGIGQISWATIIEYSVAMQFSEEQTEDLMHHIRAMDHAYLEHWNKKQSSKTPAGSKKK